MKEINNIVLIGDTHIGCSLGLMHKDGATLDEGPRVMPSPLQQRVYGWWEEFWGDFVPEATAGDPFTVIHMGDSIDGVHHGSTHQWASSIEMQIRHAAQILKPVVEACEGRFYMIRGTEAHVGPSSTDDNKLAQMLGAIPNATGQHARYELWKTLGPRVVHCAHHIGTAGSQAYESSALMRELAESMIESAKWGERYPDVLVRGHRHRCMQLSVPTSRGQAHIVVTPGWQLKTPFTGRLMSGRVGQPQFGGAIVRYSPQHDDVFVRTWVKSLKREDPE